MAKQKPKQNVYVISKKIIAVSIKEAMKKEANAEIIVISLEEENISENPIGFQEKPTK